MQLQPFDLAQSVPAPDRLFSHPKAHARSMGCCERRRKMLHKKLLLGVAIGALLSGTALAQDTGLSTEAGTIELRARGLVVIPEDNSSSIGVVGGHVDATTTAVPEVELSHFLSKNMPVGGIARVA